MSTKHVLLFSLVIAVLFALSLKPSSANESSPDWVLKKDWVRAGDVLVLEAESERIVQACREHPDHYIEFPLVIHGSQEVVSKNKTFRAGDPLLRSVRSIYGVPELTCRDILDSSRLIWRCYTRSKHFTRIQHYPRLVANRPLGNLIYENMNSITAGTLIILAVFCWFIFSGKLDDKLRLSLVGSYSSFGLYFLFSVPGLFGVDVSMITAHRFGDIFVVTALLLLFWSLHFQKLINKLVIKLHSLCYVITIPFIILGSTEDTIQNGTDLFLGITVLVMLLLGGKKVSTLFKSFSKISLLQTLMLFSFLVFAINDIMVIEGMIDGYMMSPIGILATVIFSSLSVNEEITKTYIERDYLRKNLESEVKHKTKELLNKTDQLEKTLSDLKLTQAELIQSEKLASLGTLAAGIAHEINNSLNYVNGAIRPVEKIVYKVENGDLKKKAEPLFKIMRDGLQLTFDIIESLRNYTGLNQAKLNNVSLSKVVKSVLTILRPRLKDQFEVVIDIPESLEIYADTVGLHQIFMNLLNNAIDAMPHGGSILVKTMQREENIVIEFSDTGIGIPEDNIALIFDPFFTTKEVGKGTGLGLHIVRKEVEKIDAKIKVKSQEEVGTTFSISIPIEEKSKQVA